MQFFVLLVSTSLGVSSKALCKFEVAPRMKGMGRLQWPDVSQDLRHLGRRFCMA